MKLSKTKQVVIGLIVGAVIIGIASSGPDDSKNTAKDAKTETKESGAIAENTESAKATTDAEPATLVETTEVPALTLFKTSADFRTAFNNFCKSADLELRVSKPELNEGEVNNTFKANVTENIAFVGTLNKADNTVKDLIMIGTGDGTAASGADILICMTALIGTMEPSIPAEERVTILKKLGMMSDEDVMDLQKSYDHNGFHYTITSSRQMGIWFGVSKK